MMGLGEGPFGPRHRPPDKNKSRRLDRRLPGAKARTTSAELPTDSPPPRRAGSGREGLGLTTLWTPWVHAGVVPTYNYPKNKEKSFISPFDGALILTLAPDDR